MSIDQIVPARCYRVDVCGPDHACDGNCPQTPVLEITLRNDLVLHRCLPHWRSPRQVLGRHGHTFAYSDQANNLIRKVQ